MAHVEHNPAPPVARSVEDLARKFPPFAVALYLTEEEQDALQSALDREITRETADASVLAFVQQALEVMAKIRVNIPDSAWEKSDTSLHLAVEINGVVHHMEAIEVKLEERDGATYQAVVDERNACTFDAIYDLDPSAGPLYTVEIHGRPHVIAMMPGGR